MSEFIEIKMPHFGEGMRYAKVISILKNIGDMVEEDSDVLIVETDKTAVEVSSPVAGQIADIFCKPGETIDVGSTMISIQRGVTQYSAMKDQIREKKSFERSENIFVKSTLAEKVFDLPPKQLSFIDTLRKSRETLIAASLETRVDWQQLQMARRRLRPCLEAGVPSSLELICWAVAQSMFVFEKFRARLLEQDRLMISKEAKIGIAGADENDSIDMETINITPGHVFVDMQSMLRRPEAPPHQAGFASAYHSLAISNMSAFGILSAQPVVVYPSVATLFVGAPYWALDVQKPNQNCQYVNLVLAFDHRMINGVYAAGFLKSIKKHLHELSRHEPSFFNKKE